MVDRGTHFPVEFGRNFRHRRIHKSTQLFLQRARFGHNFVVFEQHRDRAVGLVVRVSGSFQQQKVLRIDVYGRTKDGFDLFLTHAFGDLIDVCLGESLIGAAKQQHRDQNRDDL